MRLRVVPLIAGIGVAALIAGTATAANTPIAAHSADNTWSPSTATIHVGDSVTWTNDGGFHNVCVRKPGGSGCDEFRNGDAGPSWAAYTNSHTFTTAGTYSFYCEIHGTATSGMQGTITVQTDNTGSSTTDTGTGPNTGTGTTPTQTTDTSTTPTQTETQTTADRTGPAFTGKLKRRSSRQSLIIDLGSSEDAALKATVFRRAPGSQSFRKVGQASVAVKAGRNVVKLPRKAGGSGRSGAYRVKLQLVDAAGNKSGTRVLSYKLS
jgi:plastocyanin